MSTSGARLDLATLGAISGLLTVALGAFGAHALKGQLSATQLDWWQTGIDYQAMHSMALLFCGWLLRQYPGTALRVAGIAFLVGIVLFSGSLYIMALTNLRALGMVTPLGGLALLAGWGALTWHLARQPR